MTSQDFIKKYDLKVSFEQMYTIQRKLNRMNNFVFEDGVISYDKQNYLSGLKYMLSAYMVDKIKPQEFRHTVSFENFNFIEFVKDYESAMQNEFEKSGSTRDRKPFEDVGIQALDVVKAQMLSYNKPVTRIWADLIKKGSNLDNLRAATIGVLEKEKSKKAEPKAKAEKNQPKEQQANDLLEPEVPNEPKVEAEPTDIKLAKNSKEDIKAVGLSSHTIAFGMYKAMQRVINQRTWGWRLNPFNWRRWYQENKFMSDLHESLKDYMFNGDETKQLTDETLLSNTKCENFDHFTLAVRKGDIELTAENSELSELNEVANRLENEIDNDKNAIESDSVDLNSEELDFDLDTIEKDFENLKSDVNVEAFYQDPNLYAVPQKATDIFLVEDSVSDVEDIKPVEDNPRNPLNIIADDDVIPAPDMKKINEEFMEINDRFEKMIKRQETEKQYAMLVKQKKPLSSYGAIDLLRSKETSKIVLHVCALSLENSGQIDSENRLTIENIQKTLEQIIKPLWKYPEAMEQNVKDAFKHVYKGIKDATPNMNVAQKLVAAQQITDVILEIYSPVGANTEYAQYSKNFCVQNMSAEDVQEMTGYEGSFDELMTEVKVGLGLVENVIFDESIFEDNISEKAAQIEENEISIIGKIME